ncbi:MAG TPA: hypothetical protein VMF61_16880 [Candidatus Acidoferrales bacterium]|nr:hypothetical protein [Candidatus Acidoferrales bacterium]
MQRSSVGAEIGWLAFFLAIFAAAVYFMVGVVVPHHFNDKIAILIAAIFAGLAMIATRAWWTRRTRGTTR